MDIRRAKFIYTPFLVVLVATVFGPLSVGLSAQELDKVDALYFTVPYGKTQPILQVVTVTAGGAAIEFTPSARTLSGGDWLSISPSQDCCTTPAPLNVTVNADSDLPAGSYSGQVVLTAPGSSSIIEVHLVVTPTDRAAFDKTPSQISFSVKPGGGAPAAQILQINGLGDGPLQWGLVGDRKSERSFLRVSTMTGAAPTRITVEVLPEKLPDSGATAGVYTSQLLFVSAGSSVTVPVTVSVGDAMVRPKRRFTASKNGNVSATLSSPATGNANLWPANTNNCFCGGFNSQDAAFGAQTTAPDGTLSAKLTTEVNPAGGAVPHFQYIFTNLGAGQQTLSFHLKADLDSWAYITSMVDGVVQRVWFNLNNGTVGANVPAGWTAQVTPLGNGWYRCSVTFTATASAVYNGFGLAPGDQQFAYTATIGHGVFEWGQQAEHGTLSSYQPNEAPCMSVTVQRDGGLVPPGSPIGFVVSLFNQATPDLATTLNAPLPAGSGINWSINPAYGGPGTCSITGAVGSRTLSCNFSILAAGTGAAVHITSATSGTSCGLYAVTATAMGGGVPFQGSDSLSVACSSLSITKTHSGNFISGQTGTYSVVVSNGIGAGNTSGPVTLTETIPAGLTLISMQGNGWTCPGTAANNCTRTDSLGAGGSYPAITVAVSVAANAPSQVTNQVDVSGGGSPAASASDLTLISAPQQPLRFVPVTPCRIADTRNPTGPFGGPILAGGSTRDFNIPASACGIPANAAAYSLNMTVVPSGELGYLTVWPTGQPQPFVSTLNSDGRTKGNAAVTPAGLNGSVSVFATNATHLIIDINGYFVPAVGAQNLAFYPVAPCRISDTRNSAGPLGGPSLAAGVARDIPVRNSTCGIPATAQAYSLNMTAVPPGTLSFLTTWPAGSPQPLVSTLNPSPGNITANAAIVPAGVNGAISVFATQATDLVIDINGYFAPPGTGSLDFYTVAPCRVLDTRLAAGPLGGPIMGAAESRSFPVPSSPCNIPATAKAYSMQTTVVPVTILSYLTLWGGGAQPFASTLNSSDGAITGNAVLLPAGTGGVVTAFSTQSSHLILDINGYFQ